MSQTKKQYFSARYRIREEDFEGAYTALASEAFLGADEGLDALTLWFLREDAPDFERKTAERLQRLFEEFGVDAELLDASVVDEENWNAEWEQSVEPVYISDAIVITPSWKYDAVVAEQKIIINPQMSFGTGHHETTRLCAQALERAVRPGDFWVDAGTGTGALAIIALRLGARRVFAFDNDEWSVANARENLSLNAIEEEKIRVALADIQTLDIPHCDGIVANIHKNIIIDSLAKFYAALKPASGILILSGVLRFDEADIVREASAAGFSYESISVESDWLCLQMKIIQ